MRELGAEAVVAIITFWSWIREHHPTGQFAGDEIDIECAAEWNGAAGKLAAVMQRDRWLEKATGKENGRQKWRVHDWAEHQPWAVDEPERVEDGKRGAHMKHHVNSGKPRPDRCKLCRDEIEAAKASLVGGLQLPLGVSIGGATGGLQGGFTHGSAPSPAPSPSPLPSPAPIATEEKEREIAAATARARKGGATINPNYFMLYAYKRKKFVDLTLASGDPEMLDVETGRYRSEFFEAVGIWPETFDALQRAFVQEHDPQFCQGPHDVDAKSGRCKRCTFWQPIPEAE